MRLPPFRIRSLARRCDRCESSAGFEMIAAELSSGVEASGSCELHSCVSCGIPTVPSLTWGSGTGTEVLSLGKGTYSPTHSHRESWGTPRPRSHRSPEGMECLSHFVSVSRRPQTPSEQGCVVPIPVSLCLTQLTVYLFRGLYLQMEVKPESRSLRNT